MAEESTSRPKTEPVILDPWEAYDDVLSARTEVLRAHIIPIYAPDDKGVPESVGTATLLKVGTNEVLVTAAHVIVDNHSLKKLTLYVPADDQLVTVEGNCITAEDPFDIAILSGFEQSRFDKQGRTYFQYEPRDQKFVAENFMVVFAGYPNTKNKGYQGKVKEKPYSYRDKLLSDTDFAELIERGEFEGLGRVAVETHYCLRFKKDGIIKGNLSDHVSFPSLHGMSGSTLWALSPISLEGVLGPFQPCPIGIFHSGKEKSTSEILLLYTSLHVITSVMPTQS